MNTLGLIHNYINKKPRDMITHEEWNNIFKILADQIDKTRVNPIGEVYVGSDAPDPTINKVWFDTNVYDDIIPETPQPMLAPESVITPTKVSEPTIVAPEPEPDVDYNLPVYVETTPLPEDNEIDYNLPTYIAVQSFDSEVDYNLPKI